MECPKYLSSENGLLADYGFIFRQNIRGFPLITSRWRQGLICIFVGEPAFPELAYLLSPTREQVIIP